VRNAWENKGLQKDPEAPLVLEAIGIEVVRGGRTLVAVDRFELRAGTTHVLLGPNGAGKSTLLRVLNGLEPAAGRLVFEGGEVSSVGDRRALRCSTAAVFQKPYLLDTSVGANVESGLHARGVRGEEAHDRARRAMELLGIAHLADRGRGKLSGGEAQRVSVARALAVEPLVLFLDEPLASLDPPMRRSLLADLLAIIADGPTAVVWVTHDREEAVAVADYVTFLSQGRVLQTGPADAVFGRPASAEVAEFLGLESYIEGRVVVGDDESLLFVLADGTKIVCGDVPEGPALGFVFPEDVVLFREAPPAGTTSLRNLVPGTITGIQSAGRLRRVAFCGGHLELVALVTQAALDDLDVNIGSTVVAAFKASAVHILPRFGRQGESVGDRE
jgi:tungstate transport system ATP-binding protein